MAGSSHPNRYCWWVERKQIAIAQTSNGVTFTGPGTAGLSVRIYSVWYPDDLTGTDLSLDIPELPEFVVSGIVSKVSQWLYESSPETLELAQYHELQYEKSIKQGKDYAQGERIGTGSYQIKPYDF